MIDPFSDDDEFLTREDFCQEISRLSGFLPTHSTVMRWGRQGWVKPRYIGSRPLYTRAQAAAVVKNIRFRLYHQSQRAAPAATIDYDGLLTFAQMADLIRERTGGWKPTRANVRRWLARKWLAPERLPHHDTGKPTNFYPEVQVLAMLANPDFRHHHRRALANPEYQQRHG